MEKYKIYARRFIGIFLAAMAITFALNYYFDDLGIFRLDGNNPGMGTFTKPRYILSVPNKFDAFAFGSSRIGAVDFSRLGGGYRYYNMTCTGGGLPGEWLENLKMFLKGNVGMKKIFLCFDDFSFRSSPWIEPGNPNAIPYRENNFPTYLRLAFRMPRPTNIFERLGLRKKVKQRRGVEFGDLYETGLNHYYVLSDEEWKQDYARRIKEGMYRRPTGSSTNAVSHMPEVLEILKEIKRLAESRDVEINVMINPVQYVSYLCNDLQQFNEFKRELASLFDYWDFSGINSITSNNFYWYEISHARKIVGDMMTARIAGLDDITPPQDFGRYVTKDNIDEHIKFLEDNAKQYEHLKKDTIPTGEFR